MEKVHRILVFSDSHGNTDTVASVLRAFPERIDTVFFLGDGLRDVERALRPYPLLAFVSVRGNCDGMNFLGPDDSESLVSLGGVTFFLTHGHRYGVKGSTAAAEAMAQRRGASVLLYGHTHVRDFRTPTAETPLHVFNPGSIGRPIGSPPSYGVIEIEDGNVRFRHADFA